MKTKDNTDDVKLEFDPPLFHSSNSHSIVSQIMPDGSWKMLGYVTRNKFNNGRDVLYYPSDSDFASLCPVSSDWSEIVAGFKKHARLLAIRDRAIEAANVRNQKARKNKVKGRSR